MSARLAKYNIWKIENRFARALAAFLLTPVLATAIFWTLLIAAMFGIVDGANRSLRNAVWRHQIPSVIRWWWQAMAGLGHK